MDIRFEHKMVGDLHVFTSPEMPELYSAHPDRDEALKDAQSAIATMGRARERVKARRAVGKGKTGRRLTVRYLAADVFAHLHDIGCRLEDRTLHGSVWSTSSGHIFHLPDPTFDREGVTWYACSVVEEIAANRWICPVPLPLRRHSIA